MKMLLLTLIFTMYTGLLTAPPYRTLYVIRPPEINPYENIWQAVCQVESSGNPLAYHMEDNGNASIGIAQVQQSRLNDFNERTGHNYTLMDMYLPQKAKVVFMYYASDFRPNDYESISRCWNGGPDGMNKKATLKYLKLVMAKL